MSKDQTGIRELIRGAGPRPMVPAEDLAQIRATAKKTWRESVAAERKRSRFRTKNTVLALAASILMAVAIGWWLMPEWGAGAPDLVASVELVRGEVLVDDSSIAPGDELAAGSMLATGEGAQASRLALRLAAGQSVRLDQGTRLRLTSDASFELLRGAVYVDTENAVAGSDNAGVEISTPYGMVRDIGTQFQVRVGDGNVASMRVRVREGKVLLEQRGADSRSVEAGQELTLSQEGTFEQGPVDLHGAAWDWVGSVTPAMDIDGAPLTAYLEWVSRETGRELHYSNETVSTSAEAIRLSGTIEGLTPEESLSILPGSGLGHRIENGSLLIETP